MPYKIILILTALFINLSIADAKSGNNILGKDKEIYEELKILRELRLNTYQTSEDNSNLKKLEEDYILWRNSKNTKKVILQNHSFQVRDGGPIVLDLDGNGSIGFIPLKDSKVRFDFNGSYFATLTSWIKPEDGFLAIDKNNDGIIKNAFELFGNTNSYGFKELLSYDTNKDGFITAEDNDFDRLLVWQDLNSNGLSDDGELKSLLDWGITSISVNAQWIDLSTRDNNGKLNETHGKLGLDKNNNGKIEVEKELFGKQLILSNYDSNKDGVISILDNKYKDIKFLEGNFFGNYSFKSLKELGSPKIKLFANSYKKNRKKSLDYQINGNIINHQNNFIKDGNEKIAFDVNFKINKMDSEYESDHALNLEVINIPKLKPYGYVKDFTASASKDPILLMEAQILANKYYSFKDYDLFKDRMKKLIYRWSGVENIDTGSRGENINGQHLAMGENFAGRYFRGSPTSKPPIKQAKFLQNYYNSLIESYTKAFFIQVNPTLRRVLKYSYNRNKIRLRWFKDINEIEGYAPLDKKEAAIFWAMIAKSSIKNKHLKDISKKLSQYILEGYYTQAELDFFNIGNLNKKDNGFGIPTDKNRNGVILGNDQDNNIVLKDNEEASNLVYLGDGNDTLNSIGGISKIIGGKGDDIFFVKGSKGNKFISKTNSSTFIFSKGDGKDQINLSLGGKNIDTIYFDYSIINSDVTYSRNKTDKNDFNLYISIGSKGDQIKVINHFNSNGKHSDSSIERILFSNKYLYEFSEGNEIVPKLKEK